MSGLLMGHEDPWRSTSALYENERYPWAADAKPPDPPPIFDEVCNESWFIAQDLAEPPQADSEAVSAEDYSQGALGKWSRTKGNRGKGGIAL